MQNISTVILLLSLSLINNLKAIKCSQGYWSMWKYDILSTTLIATRLTSSIHQINLSTIQNIQFYDQLRLHFHVVVANGSNQEWEILLENDGTPQFQYRAYGIALTNNQKVYHSDNLIVPVSLSRKMMMTITGMAGASTVMIFAKAAKFKTNIFMQMYQKLSSVYYNDNQNQINSQWQKWLYFPPLMLLNQNITAKYYQIDYSIIPGIQNFECAKNAVFYATGRGNGNGNFIISAYGQQKKPAFSFKSFGSTAENISGFGFNSQNIIIPISKNRKVTFQSNKTLPGASLFKVSCFGLKYKSNVTKEQIKIISENVLRYLGFFNKNIQQKQKQPNRELQNEQNLNINYNNANEYPYPGYWDDWVYFEPLLIFNGYFHKQSQYIDYSSIPDIRTADQIKLWVYIRHANNVLNNTWALSIINTDFALFKHFILGQVRQNGDVTYHSQQLTIPLTAGYRSLLTFSVDLPSTSCSVYAMGYKRKRNTITQFTSKLQIE